MTKSDDQAVTSKGDVITWDEIVIDHGKSFATHSSATGYIVPYTGTYMLIFHARVDNKQAKFDLLVDSEPQASTGIKTDGDNPSTEITIALYLVAGSKVEIMYAYDLAGHVQGRTSVNQGLVMRSWFTGYLLF